MADALVDEVYAALVGLGADGASEPWPIGPLSDGQWSDLVGRCQTQRMVGALCELISQRQLDVTDSQLATALNAQLEAAHHALRVQRALLETADALRAAGISFAVLKGPALAHTIYPDPSQRDYLDLDILVADVDASVRALGARGIARLNDEVRAGFDRRFGKAVTLCNADRIEIDVHRTIAPGPFGQLAAAGQLLPAARSFTLAGVELPTLSTEEHLVQGCYHLVLGGDEPRGSNVRDIALLLSEPTLDAERVLALARGWKGEAVVAQAIRSCAERVPMTATPLTDWARSHNLSARERALLDSYRSGDRFGSMALATLRVLPWRERLAYMSALALPSRANLRTRALKRSSHLKRLGRFVKR